MGQFFAQAQVPDNDRARAVGMFTAMFLIPHFYGPALGEWSLDHWGETGFFALPIVSIAIRDAADPAAQSVIRNRNADSKARRIYRPAAQSKSTSTQSG